MAIYHLAVKTVKRSDGQSAVGSAAWHARETLYDERLGKKHRYGHFRDLADSEILIPENAPDRLKDRTILWNEVERFEKRKDAQLARVIEISLPVELNWEQRKSLVREFAQTIFVNEGMIADIALIEKESNPYATIMLTMRRVTGEGFGQKEISWNKRSLLLKWREAWANIQNRILKDAGHEVRVDHRSHAERGIDLEPQIKIGVTAKYLPGKSDFLKSTKGFERLEEYQRIRRENGERIIEDPGRAVTLLRQKSGVIKRRDLERFAKYYSVDADQYIEVLNALEKCPDLIQTGKDKKGEDLYSIREMEEARS